MTGTQLNATVHATTVALDGRGVMLLGPSGAGKSDLALRLIDRGATLVSDDYTDLTTCGDTLLASPPATIRGRIEVRGIGIVDLPYREAVAVGLVVVLDREDERMPAPRWRTIAQQRLREIVIDPRPASAAIKVEWALKQVLTESDA